MVETLKSSGPSGFIEINQNMLVVDYGKIYLEGSPCGFLYEDGLVSSTHAVLGKWNGLKSIEEIPGCIFRGIDSRGMPLELPGQPDGTTGGLTYNNIAFNVIHGRIATLDHFLVGRMNDEGILSFFDPKDRTALRMIDEESQLSTLFQGVRSDGKPLSIEFVKPLHRKERTYSDNETMRYFEQFDHLNTVQKKYVLETMRIWATAGILQIVRKSEGTAALGNVKHGTSGVTGVRTGYVTLDREEFEKEIVLFKRFGPVAVVATPLKPYLEIRINMVVSHEFGHQLEFILSQAAQDHIQEIYGKQLERCNRMHPLPGDYEGESELVRPEQVDKRVFISGYARSSVHEYWAETVAAFSMKEGRSLLKKHDPEIYKLLGDIVFRPEQVLSPRYIDRIHEMQTSLRVGGELKDDLLE